MRGTQQPASSFQASREELVVLINKRAALLLLAGMALVAAVMLYSSWEKYDRNKAAVIAETALNPVAAASSSQPNISPLPQEPPSGAPSLPATQATSVAEQQPPDPDSSYSASAIQPPPAVTVSRTTIKSYPPAPLAAPLLDSDPPDNPSAEQPSDPSPTPSPVTDSSDPPIAPTVPAVVNGAGTNLPYSLYSKWWDEFHKLHFNVQFNYVAVGSGGGIRQLLLDTVEFAATDVPMNDEQVARAKFPILHIPSVIGAVVPSYNVPGVGELRFTPEILAGIFSGKLTFWNDRAIAAANPTANLPNLPITVIHRSDGSAATFIFTDYLSKTSQEWQLSVGKGFSVHWTVGLAAKGDEGVTGLLKQTPGAIGYVDFVAALQYQLPFGSVRNLKGKFLKADFASLTAAGVLPDSPTDFRISITNAPGLDAYPISSFTWFLAPVRSRSLSETRALTAFFHWMLASSSQAMAGSLGYAPLPTELAARVNEEISIIH